MFTKLENLVVLVILALLLAFAVWTFWGRVGADQLSTAAWAMLGIAVGSGVVLLGIYIVGQVQKLFVYALGRLKRKDPT